MRFCPVVTENLLPGQVRQIGAFHVAVLARAGLLT
jgi:hypothetical protein